VKEFVEQFHLRPAAQSAETDAVPLIIEIGQYLQKLLQKV